MNIAQSIINAPVEWVSVSARKKRNEKFAAYINETPLKLQEVWEYER